MLGKTEKIIVIVSVIILMLVTPVIIASCAGPESLDSTKFSNAPTVYEPILWESPDMSIRCVLWAQDMWCFER